MSSAPTDNSAFKEITEPYFLALGRFVHQFSILETVMYSALLTICKIDPKSGAALFSGTRLSGAKDLINRVLDANGNRELKNRLKPIFDQIGIINAARNEILHHGAHYKTDVSKLMFSNARIAHVPQNVRAFEVTPTMLNNLASDTATAYSFLFMEVIAGADEAAAPVADVLRSFSTRAWQYRQPELDVPGQKSAKTAR